MVKDMTNGSPSRHILGFEVPMLFGMLFQQFYNLVDTIIVGKTLGVEALAGVGATGSITVSYTHLLQSRREQDLTSSLWI